MASINWSNITDFGNLPQAANTASDCSFCVGMLYMVWIIIILLTLSYGFEVAILTSCFASLIIGLLMVYAGLVAWQWVITFVGIMLFMFLYIIWSTSKEK